MESNSPRRDTVRIGRQPLVMVRGTDGRIKAIPLVKGYDGTRLTTDSPDCSVKAAARVDSYRGFVFASLSSAGPSLTEFLGEARIAFDDMCDRSPVGEVEAVPVCHRVVQHSNWKFFMENQLDALHPSVTHQSTGIAASRAERALKGSRPRYTVGPFGTTTSSIPLRR